jgi:hypothetical protein
MQDNANQDHNEKRASLDGTAPRIILPVTLEGSVVRLEPIRRQHAELFWETTKNDLEDIFRWIPYAMKAPADFCEKEKAVKAFKDSMDEIIAALNKADESKMLDPIMLPSGETSLMNLAYFTCMHNSYHDAQLNYLQAIHGDEKVHWG